MQDQGNNVRYTDMINAAYAFSKGQEPGTIKAPSRGWYSNNVHGAKGTVTAKDWHSDFGKGHLVKKAPGSGRIVKNPDGTWGSEW